MVSIEPDALMQQIAAGLAPAIVDVRSAREYRAGHVPGAMHLPFWQVGRQWHKLAPVRELPVVVYCGHGPRAYIAGAGLRRRGFRNVVYLAGHMKKWREMNFPVEGK
jgi:rhodanese-related sulfurtransferase